MPESERFSLPEVTRWGLPDTGEAAMARGYIVVRRRGLEMAEEYDRIRDARAPLQVVHELVRRIDDRVEELNRMMAHFRSLRMSFDETGD